MERQPDAQHLQAVLMVKDAFWAAEITQRDMYIRVLQQQLLSLGHYPAADVAPNVRVTTEHKPAPPFPFPTTPATNGSGISAPNSAPPARGGTSAVLANKMASLFPSSCSSSSTPPPPLPQRKHIKLQLPRALAVAEMVAEAQTMHQCWG